MVRKATFNRHRQCDKSKNFSQQNGNVFPIHNERKVINVTLGSEKSCDKVYNDA